MLNIMWPNRFITGFFPMQDMYTKINVKCYLIRSGLKKCETKLRFMKHFTHIKRSC